MRLRLCFGSKFHFDALKGETFNSVSEKHMRETQILHVGPSAFCLRYNC
jgi:hypothetical protein